VDLHVFEHYTCCVSHLRVFIFSYLIILHKKFNPIRYLSYHPVSDQVTFFK